MTGSGDLSLIEPSEEQKRAAEILRLNQGTPRDVGNGAQLDRVIGAGDGVLYFFTMTQLSGDEIDVAEFRKFVYETARSDICSNPKILGFFDTEAGFIEYRVRDRSGVAISTIRFDKSDCE